MARAHPDKRRSHVKVLLLHSRYGSGTVSGENRVVDDETVLLRAAGHEVRMITPSAVESGQSHATLALNAVWSRDSRRAVERAITEFSPDVMHVHNVFPMLSPAVLRGGGGIPIVMTLHNYRLQCLPATLLRGGIPCNDCVGRAPWPGVLHACYRDSRLASAVLAGSLSMHRVLRTFEHVTLFAAVADFVRDRHVAAGIGAERIVTKPNFAWPSRIRTGPGEYFLYIGRLAQEKGVLQLLDVWTSNLPELVIVGSGPLEVAVRDRVKMLPNARVESAIPPTAVQRVLVNARALLVPSVWDEPAPRVVLEAYACGVPVIASKVGGLTELVVPDESGFTVPVFDTTGWKRSIDALIDDRTSTRFGDGAFARWEAAYSPEVATRNLEHIYDAAARLRRSRELVGDV